jgi:hypothetical protein
MYFLVFIKLFNTKKGKNLSILVASEPDPEPDPDPDPTKKIRIRNTYLFKQSSHTVQ